LTTAAEWYDANPDLQNYYQGDVLSDFPFPTMPTFLPATKQDVWAVLRPRDTKGRSPAEAVRTLPNSLIGRAAQDWPDVWTLPHGEFVIAACKKMNVMVVSRSCDIDKQSRKHFLVAPVFSVEGLPEAQRTAEKLRDLRANEIMHWFYLPAKNPNLPESFSDLTRMVHLHRSFFDERELGRVLLARLSAYATAAFQRSMSDFYGTKFGFVSEDVCPQTARYACSSCFYSGQPIPRSRNVEEGQVFGDCDSCTEKTLWIKIPELP
jgi:hypothetical protein